MLASDRSARFRARTLARHMALSALSWQGRVTGSTVSGLRRKRVHFLYLHSVFPGQEEGFRTLLERLAQDHRFVSYSDAVRRISVGEIDASYATFSFDDGFLSCLRAAEILDEFGASAAFFICPKLVGHSRASDVRRVFGAEVGDGVEPTMSWDEIETLMTAGHEVGSHTLSHVNLANASRDRIDEEIGGSFEVLTARIGSVEHFAWPFGRFRHFGPEAAARVFEAGFETCASAERGCHTHNLTGSPRQLCLRRENVEPSQPVAHHLFSIGRSSRRADAASNLWPAAWRPQI